MKKISKNYIRIFITGLAVSLFLFFIVWGMKEGNGEKQTFHLSASWGYGYADLEEITQKSDVIAIVKVDGEPIVETLDGIPYSEYPVRVSTAILGVETKELLRVYMTGGTTENGDTIVMDDDPLFEKGIEYLIFAQKNDSGTITVLGGPQGRFVCDNGKVNSLHIYYEKPEQLLNFEINNQNIDSVVDQVQKYLK